MLKVLGLLAELTDPDRRRSASVALAQYLEAEDLILFVADPNTGTHIPGTGFPEILPESQAWQSFVKACVRDGEQQGELFRPEDGTPIQALGFRLTDGSVLVLLGGSPNVSEVRYCCLLLLFVTELLRREYAFQMLSLEVSIARAMADQMKALAEGAVALDRDIQQLADESLTIRKSTEDTLRLLCARLLKQQDDERRKTSSELYGSAGRYLTGVQTNLGAALRNTPTIGGGLVSQISNASEMMERCNSTIKAISYSLHPPLLDDMGLIPAISWYAEDFAQQRGIRVELNTPPRPNRLPREIETVLFRAVQEGLSNIYQHSGSPVARVRVAIDAGQVTLQISDEGHGIPPETVSKFHADIPTLGVGISGMRERIRELGGRMNIQSSENGTMVEVSLPLND
jgi:signal transduction histidine kinase